MGDSSAEEADDAEERVFAAERIEKRRIRKVCSAAQPISITI